MSSKYIDSAAIIQVIGNVYNNPSLLDMSDKYVITEQDFPNEFHRIVFGSLYKLYELGIKEFNLESINDFLSTRPKSEAVYKNNKGDEWLLKTADSASSTSFDYYYKRLKKFTLLRTYDNFGIDVSDIYDVDNILDVKKKQLQEELLDSRSLEEIADQVDEKIEAIRLQCVGNDGEVAYQAGDGIMELLERFKKYPEAGIPMYGPLVNTVTRGARLGRFYLRSAPTGVGKCIPDYTIIPTPLGERKVSDIKVGDELFDGFGNPTKVLAVYPQGEKEVWEVKFKDGRIAECCEEHLWSYCTTNQTQASKENREFYTSTLKELYGKSDEYQILVPMQQAVHFPQKDFSINPYTLGAALENSKNIFIPQEYFMGSIEQRLDLLNGLLDVNGSVNEETGQIDFYTVSEQLKEDVIKLSLSLGFKAEYKDTLPIYKIEIDGKPEDKIKLFRLSQKKEKVLEWFNNGERKENSLFNPIVKITKTNKKTAMTCFYVDNEEHLFLMNDFIVTHNTRSMIADACYFACERIYDSQFGWIRSGPGQPTLYISTEQDLEEVQTMMLAFIANVSEEHIIYNEYEDGEEERVREAARMLAEAPLYVETMPDFSLQDVENTIKKNLRDHKVRYICHDYIHSSLKILEEITRRSGGVKLREDNVLFMLSTKLKDICVKYGVFIISATQLSGDYTNAETPDQNLLRGAKSIADKVDAASILLPVRADDLVKLEPILNSKVFDTPTIKISVYKNRRGRYKSIYLWCKADLGTCRIQPMFATTYGYELIEMDDIRITVEDNEPSAF